MAHKNLISTPHYRFFFCVVIEFVFHCISILDVILYSLTSTDIKVVPVIELIELN